MITGLGTGVGLAPGMGLSLGTYVGLGLSTGGCRNVDIGVGLLESLQS